MAATYLGGVTVAGAIPGASAQLQALGSALQTFRDTVEVQFGKLADVSAELARAVAALTSAAADLSTQAQAVLDAKVAIRVPAVVDFQAQLDAALSVSANLNLQLSDPSLYLAALVSGIAHVEANIALMVPTVALDAQIAASAGVAAAFEAKIADVDLQLDALSAINLALRVVVDAIARIRAALSAVVNILAAIRAAIAAALQAALVAISAYAAFAQLLLASGIDCYLYDGALSGLGAAIDAVTPSGSFSGSTIVRVPVVVVDVANTDGLDGVNATFKVS